MRDVELRRVNNPQVRFTGVLETAKVAAVRRLVEVCGAQIVVSSSWREAFESAPAFNAAIGLAPPLANASNFFHRDWRTEKRMSSNRHHEIDSWLREHPKVTRYATLDDHPIWGWGSLPDNSNEVRTDPEIGITNCGVGSVLDAKHFRDEAAAYKWVEARVWPNGRVCPHCGSVDDSGPLKGKSTRIGVYKCYAKECRKPFTVKVGTIFEASHIKLHVWLQAMFLLASSKKGISSNQLARTLGVTLKSAWHLSHRIRLAMTDTSGGMFGSGFGGVESDETLQGMDPRRERPKDVGASPWDFNRVLTLIDRDTGAARSFVMTEFTTEGVQRILNENVAKEAYLLTDEAPQYMRPGAQQTFHGTTNHGEGEYVRADAPWVHTNTVEGYYSIFKRGMKGVYQHCGRNHLHRYTAEFDFRYTNRAKLGVDDVIRFAKIVEGVKGKRLTYRSVDRGAQAKA